jgi:hypothetical protein
LRARVVGIDRECVTVFRPRLGQITGALICTRIANHTVERAHLRGKRVDPQAAFFLPAALDDARNRGDGLSTAERLDMIADDTVQGRVLSRS